MRRLRKIRLRSARWSSGLVVPRPIWRTFGWLEGGDDRTPGWLSRALKPLDIVLLTGLIYSLLEPGFGLNSTTLILLVSMVAGISMSTFLFEGGQVFWSTKRYETPAVMRIYPLAIVIAALSVLLTKLVDLQPGVIFGFVTAAAILPRASISPRDRGMIVLVPVLGLLIRPAAPSFSSNPCGHTQTLTRPSGLPCRRRSPSRSSFAAQRVPCSSSSP